MATTNGYTPEQASDLYITDGHDRTTGCTARYRIFAFTFEMSPDSPAYPPDEAIPTETARNRGAVLYLLDMADCPYRSIGLSVDACRVTAGAARR